MRPPASGRPFRYEWDGVMRRLKLSPTVKLVAAYVSQYADNDGRNTRPGVKRLALETGFGEATIKRSLATLRGLGLLALVRSGSSQGRRAKANEYRLAIPDDLLEKVSLVDGFGAERSSADEEQGSSGDPCSGGGGEQSDSSAPVDNEQIRDHQMIPDNPPGQPPAYLEQGSPSDPGSPGTGITDDQNRDHQMIPHQAIDHASSNSTTPEEHSPTTAPLTPREDEPVDNPKTDIDEEAELHPTPAKCPEHGLAGGTRHSDGMPACPICRRQARRNVIPIRSKAA